MLVDTDRVAQCEVCTNWLEWDEGFEEDGLTFCSDKCARVFRGEADDETAETSVLESV